MGLLCLQMQEKSLAEVLLVGAGRELRLSLPWGPSVEDALLGQAGPSAGPEEEKPDQQELSSKVMHPSCMELKVLVIMRWPGSPDSASEGSCKFLCRPLPCAMGPWLAQDILIPSTELLICSGIWPVQACIQQRPPLAMQVLRVGMQLLVAQQVPALSPVLRLAGTVSEEPALQFLKVEAHPCMQSCDVHFCQSISQSSMAGNPAECSLLPERNTDT